MTTGQIARYKTGQIKSSRQALHLLIDKSYLLSQTLSMNRLARKFIAILIVSVIALTVMAPDFIWEANASHEYSVSDASTLSLADAHDGQQSATDHHDDHPCGCHMFGHLPIQASASSTPLFPKWPETFGFHVKTIHSSPAPDLIDQPPKSSLA
ncbi:MAG: hypothetical protein EPO42_08535 [Gallionellaceae bacterium]|nr:MAG: hypothetical protein EPO42_08535 [Gallionellaceae bacterium]